MASEDYVPFGEAMDRIERARLDFGPDRWELWVSRRLVEPAARIPGTNDYGLPVARWERLKMLLTIDHQLFGRKSPEAVAYYAALWGIDVPVKLVADHLVKSIEAFYRILRRRVIRQSNGLFHPRELDESDVRRLASKAAKDIQNIVPIKNPMKRALANQFAEELCFVAISIIYNVKATRSLGSSIRQIANAIFRPAALGARFIRKALQSEKQRFIDPEVGSNRILREIRTTQRQEPDLIQRACRDSGLVFAAVARAFGVDEQRKGRPPNDLTGTARENARLFYTQLPLVSAYFLGWNLDSPNSKFLSTLRNSHGSTLEQQIKRIDRLSEWQRHRLEKGL